MAAGTPRPRHWCGARAGVVALVLFLVAPAAAGTTTDAGFDQGGVRFSLLPEGERLALEDIAPTPAEDPTVPPAAPERRPNWLLTPAISAGALVGSALNSVFDGNHESHHVGNEGWFGPNTHFGGADKAAHFVDYYIVSKEFAKLFVVLGHKPENARWLAAGVFALTGDITALPFASGAVPSVRRYLAESTAWPPRSRAPKGCSSPCLPWTARRPLMLKVVLSLAAVAVTLATREGAQYWHHHLLGFIR